MSPLTPFPTPLIHSVVVACKLTRLGKMLVFHKSGLGHANDSIRLTVPKMQMVLNKFFPAFESWTCLAFLPKLLCQNILMLHQEHV